MTKEIWIFRHGRRLNYDKPNEWIKLPRYKENHYDTPLSDLGFKLAYKSGLELIEKSNAIKNNKIKFIYSSPFTRCIQTAIEIIKAIKDKLGYQLKIIVVYNLGETGSYYSPNYTFKNNKLMISKPEKKYMIPYLKKIKNFFKLENTDIIDSKLKPDALKRKYKEYIHKTIGSNIEYESKDDVSFRMANTIININKKEKNSYIIVGHWETAYLSYKYFNQNNQNIYDIKNTCYPSDWVLGWSKTCNVMMGFEEIDSGYKMIYEPNYNFN